MQESSKKKETQFSPTNLASKLAGHTIHIIKNKTYFPEECQEAMNSEIIKIVLELSGKTNRANRVYINRSNKEEAIDAFKQRIKLENEAIELCEVLLDRISTIKLAYHLNTKKATNWARMTKNTKYSIISWQKHEKAELARLLK